MNRSISILKILNLPETDFLPTLYRAALDREPDPEGEEHYYTRLANGILREQVAFELLTSREATLKKSSEIISGANSLIRKLKIRRLLGFKKQQFTISDELEIWRKLAKMAADRKVKVKYVENNLPNNAEQKFATSNNSKPYVHYVNIAPAFDVPYNLSASNDDPQIWYNLENSLMPGWIEIKIDIKSDRHVDILELFLIDEHAKFDMRRHYMPYTSSRPVSLIIKTDVAITGIRLDPFSHSGPFTLIHFSANQVNDKSALEILSHSIKSVQEIYKSDQNINGELDLCYSGYVSQLNKAQSYVTRNLPYLNYLASRSATNKENYFVEGEIKFTIVIPTYNSNIHWLEQAIDSVIRQSYANWELCLSDDASPRQAVRDLITHYAKNNSKIKYIFREKNGGIGRATNDAIGLADGDWLCFMDHDDLLDPLALETFYKALNKNPDALILYSDEDKIDEYGNHSDPHFKSDWNPELLLNHNYITHFVGLNYSYFVDSLTIDVNYEGCQDFELLLRLTNGLDSKQVIHVPQILYHWRAHAESTALTALAKTYSLENGKKALLAHMKRLGVSCEVNYGPFANSYRVRRKLNDEPSVEIIIPTRDHLGVLRPCIESILSKTRYGNFSIRIIDNLTTDKEAMAYLDALSKANGKISVTKFPFTFNWAAINNYAAKQSDAEIFIFLNNDIEIVDPGWVSELVSHAMRAEIGCVGAKLLYPDRTVQHAGVFVGLGGLAGHAHSGIGAYDLGYMGRACLSQNLMAVTGACLAVRSSVFRQINGFDERYAIAFNDVDFCLKVYAAGYLNLYTPYAVLMHHESKSRGYEDTPEKKTRFTTEAELFKSEWFSVLQNDVFYNTNLSRSHPFSIDFVKRAA